MQATLNKRHEMSPHRLGSFKQQRRWRRQGGQKSANLTMRNSIFARFARAIFIFVHFAGIPVQSTT